MPVPEDYLKDAQYYQFREWLRKNEIDVGEVKGELTPEQKKQYDIYFLEKTGERIKILEDIEESNYENSKLKFKQKSIDYFVN